MPIGDCLWLLIDDVDNGLDDIMKYYEVHTGFICFILQASVGLEFSLTIYTEDIHNIEQWSAQHLPSFWHQL